jgi:hypothetical protein
MRSTVWTEKIFAAARVYAETTPGENMGKSLAELFQKLVDSPVSLVIVLGFITLILGLSGGVQYNNWFPIASGAAQIAAITIGVIVLLVGIFVVLSRPVSSRPYGITITSPQNNDAVDITRVEGTIRKFPPPKYELWLLRIYRDGEFTPIQRVSLVKGREKWLVPDCDIGGTTGDHRTIAAFLINPAGQLLFEYFRAAARRHNQWMDKLQVARSEPDRYLPNIDRSAIEKVEMIECDRVDLVRK